MSRVTNPTNVDIVHGKTSKKSKGYFYEGPQGQQLYRDREETYQRKRSPFQLWHTASFVWAHKQIHDLWQNEQTQHQITDEWKMASRRGPNDKIFPTPQGWKFAILQQQWKSEHPFEPWYEQYLHDIQSKVAEKTASETTSTYMLRRQKAELIAQLEALDARIKQSENPANNA